MAKSLPYKVCQQQDWSAPQSIHQLWKYLHEEFDQTATDVLLQNLWLHEQFYSSPITQKKMIKEEEC